jgi:hypothetical protein
MHRKKYFRRCGSNSTLEGVYIERTKFTILYENRMSMSATWGSSLTYSYWSLMIRLEEIFSDTVDNLLIELKK